MARGWRNRDPLQWYDRRSTPMGHALRNLWCGKSGFLVCGGPSINQVDHRKLADRGICSLAINNVSGYVPVSAMTFSDPAEKFHYGVMYDPCILKLVPKAKLRQKIRLKHPETGEFIKTKTKVSQLPSVFAYERWCEFHADQFLTSPAATWGNDKNGVKATGGKKTLNTMLLGLRVLHYLGVRRVYMLGVDFAMRGEKGRQLGNYAFEQAGSPSGNNNAYRVLVEWFTQLKPIFDDDGFEVYNCNSKSHLTVFPYVDFDHAVEDCRSPVPVEPFDLSGWYESSEDKGKSKDPDE